MSKLEAYAHQFLDRCQSPVRRFASDRTISIWDGPKLSLAWACRDCWENTTIRFSGFNPEGV